MSPDWCRSSFCVKPEPTKIKPLRGVVIANGPSLTRSQIQMVEDHPDDFLVIGVNNAFEICPFLDCLYAADFQWLDAFLPKVPKHIEVWSTYHGSAKDVGWKPHERVNYVPGDMRPGFSVRPDFIHHGGHSGYQAMNLAFLKGCRQIIMLGIDMKGYGHWFGEYDDPKFNKKSNWGAWLSSMDSVAEQMKGLGVEIVNCSPDSAVNSFPKRPLAEALNW